MPAKIQVVLQNRTAYFAKPYPYEDIIPHFSFSAPWARFSEAYNTFNEEGERQWDGRIKFLKRNKCASGLFRAIRKEVEEKANVKFAVTYERQKIKIRDGLSSNRDFQNECVEEMLKAAPKGGGLIINATGTGKTRLAAIFSSRVVGRVLFVVNTLDLLEQAQKEIAKASNEEVGYVGNQVFKPNRITIATIQTLSAHLDDPRFQYWTNSLDVMIVDEVHEMINKQNFAVIEQIQPAAVFGLTATLQLKKKEIRLKAYSLAGPVVYNYPISLAVQNKHISPGIVLQCAIDRPVFKEGVYKKEYDRLVIDDSAKNKLIRRIAKYAYKKGKYTVLLVNRKRHLFQLSDSLKDIPHRTAWGGIEVRDRKKAIDKIEKGSIRLIIANQVFKKGINIKRIDLGIDASEGKSPNDAIQKYGRLTRLHPDKEGFIYIDIGSMRNRFEKNTNKRKRAFSKEKIPVKRIILRPDQVAETPTRELFDIANKMLRKELKKYA